MRYAVFFKDNPDDALYVEAKNKTEARDLGRAYNRMWELRTTIDRIEEAQEE